MEWPTDLRGVNRVAIAGNPNHSWILTSYQTSTNAFAGTNGFLGTYASGGSAYPLPYGSPGIQIFFRIYTTGGMRANSAWDTSCCDDGEAGTLVCDFFCYF